MSFDLQIAGADYNATCTMLNTGNVVLSYRIGTNSLWKVIGEYSAAGELTRGLIDVNVYVYQTVGSGKSNGCAY